MPEFRSPVTLVLNLLGGLQPVEILKNLCRALFNFSMILKSLRVPVWVFDLRVKKYIFSVTS